MLSLCAVEARYGGAVGDWAVFVGGSVVVYVVSLWLLAPLTGGIGWAIGPSHGYSRRRGFVLGVLWPFGWIYMLLRRGQHGDVVLPVERDSARTLWRAGLGGVVVAGVLVLLVRYGGDGGGPHFTSVQRPAIERACAGAVDGAGVCDCVMAQLDQQFNQLDLDRIAAEADVMDAPVPQEVQNAVRDCNLRDIQNAPNPN
jgi:hypothetical protein